MEEVGQELTPLNPSGQVNPDETSSPLEELERLTTIKDNEILAIRKLMDVISWSLFDISRQESEPILRFHYLNMYLIDSYNWFATQGLRTFFENKEIVIPQVGILKVTDFRLDRPRRDELGKGDRGETSADLMWPQDARLGGVNYWGAFSIDVELILDANYNTTGKLVELIGAGIPFGKLHVMLGSKFDNLTNHEIIRNVEDLKLKGEDPKDFVGYFIVNGYEKNLITQVYRINNAPICIPLKGTAKTISSTDSKPVCEIMSKGADWTISPVKVFIMSASNNKLRNSDKRIYVHMSFIKKNIFDAGEAFVGFNIISIFRLAVIYLHTINPLAEDDSYLIGGMKGVDERRTRTIPAGFRGNPLATYAAARKKFEEMIRMNAGEKFWAKIVDYVTDTVNEASTEADELTFWKHIVEKNAPAAVSGPTLTVEEKGAPILELFAEKFLPHCSEKTLPIQVRYLKSLRNAPQGRNERSIKGEIHEMHRVHILQHDARLRTATAQYPLLAADIAASPQNDIPAIPDDILNADTNTINREINISMKWLSRILSELDGPESINMRTAYLSHLFNRRGVAVYVPDSDMAKLYPYVTFAYSEFRSIERDMNSRLNLLTIMTLKVLSVELGFDTYDNRDSPAVQRYEHPGLLMMSRFAGLFRKAAKAIQKQFSNKPRPKTESIRSAIEGLGRSIMAKEFNSAFSTGKWNDKGVKKERNGVTDMMPPTVPIARISYLRRMSAQGSAHSDDTSSREISGLQPGAICPAETPEGKQCGNVEHLASAAYITNESFDKDTLAYKLYKLKTSRRRDITNDNNNNAVVGGEITKLQSMASELRGTYLAPQISNTRSAVMDCILYLNGKYIGWVRGLSFKRILINMRRAGTIHPHTGIHFTQRATKVGVVRRLKIDTTGGRIVQPLIVAEDPVKTMRFLRQLVLNQQSTGGNISGGKNNDAGKTIEDFIAEGMIEFIDSAELEFLDLAPSVDVYLRSIQSGLPERFDHIMLNPAFLLGSSANVMPFANMNPIVRNSYFTAMVKQPVDVPMSTFSERAVSAIAKLHEPQMPLVITEMYNHILADDPFGVNVDILIAPDMFGEEDGIVINEKFINMGGLESTKYSAFTMVVDEGSNTKEELNFGQEFFEKGTIPEPDRYGRGVIRVKRKVVKKRTARDENGNTIKDAEGNDVMTSYIIEEPVIVQPHEILARKTWFKNNNQEYDDLIFDSLRPGIVDRIMWNKGAKDTKILSVIIRWPDDLYIGDKIASRYAQKGVIARVARDVDMPFDPITGKTPDLIINPQGLPSRMTIGQMAEVLVSNAYVSPDRNKNVYMLYVNRGLDIFAPLERLFVLEKKLWYQFQRRTHKHDWDETRSDHPDYVKDSENNNECEINAEDAKVKEDTRTAAEIMNDLLSNFDNEQTTIATSTPTENRPDVSVSTAPIIRPDNIDDYILVSSSEINDQAEMDFAKANDIIVIRAIETGVGLRNGLWGLKIYQSTIRKSKAFEVQPKTLSRREMIAAIGNDKGKEEADSNENTNNVNVPRSSESMLHDIEPTTRVNYITVLNGNGGESIEDYVSGTNYIPTKAKELIAGGFVSLDVEIVNGLWFDIEFSEDDERINPLTAIRVSNIPSKATTNTSDDANSIDYREMYVRGNVTTPVADQLIVAYKSEFFKPGNLREMYFDFVLPYKEQPETQIIKDVIVIPEEVINIMNVMYEAILRRNKLENLIKLNLGVKLDEEEKELGKILATLTDNIQKLTKYYAEANKQEANKQEANLIPAAIAKSIASRIQDTFKRDDVLNPVFALFGKNFQPIDVALPSPALGFKYSDLKKYSDNLSSKVKYLQEEERYVFDNKGNKIVVLETGEWKTEMVYFVTTLKSLWNDAYSRIIVPQRNVIDLPINPRDIYLNRRDRLNSLRTATVFKIGDDINDAMQELELMGYEKNGSRQYINGITGQPINGLIVSGFSYYMGLKHKVKGKMQARGTGKANALTRQPVQGRTKGGGLRFNFMDALAVIKSGASAFVADRMLDSSGKTDVYVCTSCKEICYKKSKEGGGAIICPMCRDSSHATKISIPYVFSYQRNLLMAAGVRLQLDVSPDVDV